MFREKQRWSTWVTLVSRWSSELMSHSRGLDQQVVEWIKAGRSADEARFFSGKEVYASNQIKYPNKTYWLTQINRTLLERTCSEIELASDTVVQSSYPNRLSVNAFKIELQNLQNKCDVDILDYAIRCGQNEFLRCMIDSGTSVDRIIDEKRSWRMIHLGVLNTDILRIKFLVAHGADINASDYEVLIVTPCPEFLLQIFAHSATNSNSCPQPPNHDQTFFVPFSRARLRSTCQYSHHQSTEFSIKITSLAFSSIMDPISIGRTIRGTLFYIGLCIMRCFFSSCDIFLSEETYLKSLKFGLFWPINQMHHSR